MTFSDSVEVKNAVSTTAWGSVNREDSRLQAIIDWDIQKYVSESINQGKIRIPMIEISNLRTTDYFSDEAWEVLRASFDMLAQNPDISTSQKCISLVAETLWEKEAEKVSEIILTRVFPDAQKANENGVNISQNDSHIHEMAQKRKTLVEELKQISSHVSEDFLKNARINELETELQRKKIFKKKFS